MQLKLQKIEGQRIMKKLIVFDLDGTLAESKSPLDTEMSSLLHDLLRIVKVAVISGGDWVQFEKQLLAMARTAHRFSVLLPVYAVTEDPYEMDRQLRLARRIVELEKPVHTVFDVRFYWALNRVGEARLGLDTLLDVGSRAPQLIPDTVLGRAYVGASFVGGPKSPTDGPCMP